MSTQEAEATQWFILDVLRRGDPKRPFRRGRPSNDWVALIISVPPDDLKNYAVDFPALFYVHPDEHRPGQLRAQQRSVPIPGKHKTRDDAWDHAEQLIATRH